MHASIVKGMPYVTMVYDQLEVQTKDGDRLLPTIFSEKPLAADPVVDNKNHFKCESSRVFRVEREIELLIAESDFSWLVFFSEPVHVRCSSDADEGLSLQVVDRISSSPPEESNTRPLVIRVAWLKSCSTGRNPIYCHQELMHPSALMLGQGLYGDILRNHSNYFPGPKADFGYSVDDSRDLITLTFDWDAQSMSPSMTESVDSEMITFALPHHYETLDVMPTFDGQIYCVASMIGPACLTRGSKWELAEEMPDISMRAPRPPAPWAMAALAESLKEDIRFRLPSYYKRGAGDTYFSGKRLAKLARVLAIAEETMELCASSDALYHDVCGTLSLPSSKDMDSAVAELRSSVEVWLNGSATTPFVYDSAWGGIVSCGCHFDEGKQDCRNRFPSCPCFEDPGLDFGNGKLANLHDN